MILVFFFYCLYFATNGCTQLIRKHIIKKQKHTKKMVILLQNITDMRRLNKIIINKNYKYKTECFLFPRELENMKSKIDCVINRCCCVVF